MIRKLDSQKDRTGKGRENENDGFCCRRILAEDVRVGHRVKVDRMTRCIPMIDCVECILQVR